MNTKKGFKKIKIDLTEKQIATIAILAHKKDITFNEYVNEMLLSYINKMKKMSKKQIDKIFNNRGNYEN